MVVKKKEDFTDKIANLLPEGLNEELIGKIADIIKNKIDEQVKTQIGSLTVKVTSFIRGSIEKLKEQAKKELELENETFRNAQMFETVKSMFAVENTPQDETNAINSLSESVSDKDNKLEVLVTEVDRLVRENVTLKRNTKILTDHNEKLKKSVVSLKENVELTKNKKSDKILSDTAVVVSEQNFKIRDTNKEEDADNKVTAINEWLTAEVLKSARKIGIGNKDGKK